MKKKPYQTKEDTANYAEDPVVAYGNVNDGVSSTCGSFDASTCESNRMTVSEYFDEIRTVLRKKYENVFYSICLLILLCPVKLLAQEFLTPTLFFTERPHYQERLYRELLYDDYRQTYKEGGHVFNAFYLVWPYNVTCPTPPEYAFVVKDSMIVLKRAKSNIWDALFAQERIKNHNIKNYNPEQQQRMRKAAKSLKSYKADVWTMPASSDFCRRLADLFDAANLTATYLECRNETVRTEENVSQPEREELDTPGDRYFGYWLNISKGYRAGSNTRTGRLALMADSICYAIEHHDTTVLNRQYFVCKALAKEFKQDIPVCYFTPWCNKSAGTVQPWQVRFHSHHGNFELNFNVDRLADKAMIEEYRRLYSDSVAVWTRETYIINPFRRPEFTVEETDTVECHIFVEPQSRRYWEICEVSIPKALLRRDIILSVLELPLGRYRLNAENRWVPIR